MKKYFISLTLLFLPHLALAENQVNDIFVHIDTGLSMSQNLKGNYQNNMGNAGIIGAGVKYQFTPQIKLGTSFNYRTGYKYNRSGVTTVITGDATNTYLTTYTQKANIASWMLNGSYEFTKMADKITPYVEAGAGYSRIYLSSLTVVSNNPFVPNGQPSNSQIKYNFTWNAGVGAAFALNNKTSLDFNYKYSHFGKIKTVLLNNTTEKGKLTANEFLLSLKIKL